jgi:hypothetical protein
VTTGWRKALVVGSALIVAAAAYVAYDFFHWRLNTMTVYATSTHYPSWVRGAATFRLMRVSTCPNDQFAPSSTLAFIIAVMDDSSTDYVRSKSLFRHFQSVGCDVNMASRGLRPLQEAILYRDANLVAFLLERGADPSLKVLPPNRHAGLDSYQWAEWGCSRPGRSCKELLEVLQPTAPNYRIERTRER